MNDFFKEIDDELAQKEKQAQDKRAKGNDYQKLMAEISERLRPILAQYVEELEKRGIRPETKVAPDKVEFKLNYSCSACTGIRLVYALKIKEGLRIISLPTERDDSDQYDRETWKDELFIDHLQQCIKDFVNRM
jgi:hypothetical protein